MDYLAIHYLIHVQWTSCKALCLSFAPVPFACAFACACCRGPIPSAIALVLHSPRPFFYRALSPVALVCRGIVDGSTILLWNVTDHGICVSVCTGWVWAWAGRGVGVGVGVGERCVCVGAHAGKGRYARMLRK